MKAASSLLLKPQPKLCKAAAAEDKVGEVLLYISEGADLCGPVPEALSLACESGSTDAIVALIAAGGDVDGVSRP